MYRFFDDDEWNFLTIIALGSSYYQAADVGEVLAVIGTLEPGNAGQWVDGWAAMGDRVAADAERSASAGRDRSASRAFLRAAMYYSTAGFQADAAGRPDAFSEHWEHHAACFDRFVDLVEYDTERITIPYEGTTLPGFVFRSAPGAPPRRTLIFNNGSDGPWPSAWVQGVAAALDRGWNAVMFDGPGENAALVRQGLHFRHDWEKVITPVVDVVSARGDVDADRMALLGVSQGGYWVPRAVAFEHRLAAAVADPGVVDVFQAMNKSWDDDLQKLIDTGDRKGFNDAMDAATQFVPSLKALLAFRGRPYGGDAFDMFTGAQQNRLADDVIAQITTPLLLTDPDNEQFWPGQAQRLYEKLRGPKAIVRFTEEEGADLHCEVAANGIRNERVFDWLDEQVPA